MTGSAVAKAEEKTEFAGRSILPMISTATKADLETLLNSQPVLARTVQEFLLAIRPIYWTPNTTTSEDRAVLVAWDLALEGVPHALVQDAFRWWLRTQKRRPVPADIIERVEYLANVIRMRIENIERRSTRRPWPAEVEEEKKPLTQEQRDKLSALLNESGVLVRAEAAEARRKCFMECQAGLHTDPENGVVAPCRTADDCQGWRAYMGRGGA